MAERREHLRAADADRQVVADTLRSALDEGRLSLHEYDERLQETYAARTYGDLDRLLADLPAQTSAPLVPRPSGTPVTVPTAAAAPVDRAVPQWLAKTWGAWLIAVSVNVAIWLIVSLSAGRWIYPWPVWVAGPWGAVLIAVTITGLLSGEPWRPADEKRKKKKKKK